MRTTFINGASLISMDATIGDCAAANILIADGKIREIGPDLVQPDDAEVIDASTMIVMPGLIDAHLHTWQTALRGIAGDWSLTDYGREMHTGLATHFTPEDIYIANLVGALNQINSGATTLFDWCHNNPTPTHTDRAIDALAESGIRAVFGHGTPKPKLGAAGVPTSELLHPEDEVRRLREERFADEDALVTLALCIRGTDLASYEATEHDIRLARKYGAMASAHLGARLPQNRKTPDGLLRLAAAGLLGSDFNAVHANKLGDDELKVMIDAGCSFTMAPEVEAQMGHGLPITGRLRGFGAAPSIGIDVESNIGSEMLWAARFALQLQRGLDNQIVNEAGSEADTVSLSARDALAWVTIEGARTLRMEDRIGSITPGKQADIIFIRKDDLNLFPCNDPVEAVLFQSSSANVDTVMIAGRIVKSGGVLVYGNLDRQKERLAESGHRLFHDFASARA
jgi:cytosine/adenosine deaminase-related metal-dependent hydrolase